MAQSCEVLWPAVPRRGMPRPERWRQTSLGAGETSAVAWVQVALWLGFFGQLLRAVHSVSAIYHGGRLLVDLSAVLFIFVGVHRLFAQAQAHLFARAQTLCYALLACTGMAAVVGLANRNPITGWVLLGFLPLMSASVILLGSHEELFFATLRTVMRQLFIAVVYAAFVLLFARPSDRFEFHGLVQEGYAKVAVRLFYALPLVLPMMSRLPRIDRFVVALAYTECIMLHIIGQNRGPVLLWMIIFPIVCLALAVYRHGSPRICAPALRTFAAVAVLAAPAVNLAFVHNPDLLVYARESLDHTVGRLAGHSSGTNDVEMITEGTLNTSRNEFLGNTSRGGEFKDFWEQLEPIDFVCGRGLGGTWYSRYWGVQWYMVHIIPGNLILIGGVPLLAVFFALLGYAWICTLRVIRAAAAGPSIVCMLLLCTIAMVVNGDLADSNELAIYWVTVGLALGEDARRRQRGVSKPRPAAQDAALAPRALLGRAFAQNTRR